ncbi:hypothetical protein [Streptosporangium canum]|uniref:hypothetical protein n=1 Tax=Streptosporangium canum TaxID=324952 RepID=UPI00341CEABD
MSYDVCVYGPADESGEGQELYEAALGSHGAIRHYWVKPAQLLGLPLLSLLPGEDLTVRHEELAALSTELQTLVKHWIDTVPDDETIMYHIEHRRFRIPLLIDLLDRVDRLRAAIRIAELTGGYLYI